MKIDFPVYIIKNGNDIYIKIPTVTIHTYIITFIQIYLHKNSGRIKGQWGDMGRK